MLLGASSMSGDFAALRERVAGLGSSPSSRYFHPHRPLLFLALASLFEPAEDPPDMESEEFRLEGDLANAYRRLATPGEQWPPKPSDAFFGLHRAGIWTVHGPDGRPLESAVGRKPAGRLGDFVARLGPSQVRMLVDPRTRPYLLAAAFFQFCPRQKEALAGAWEELDALFRDADFYERYAETEEGLPITPPTLEWAPLEKPPKFDHPINYEKFFKRILQKGGNQVSILGQVPLDADLVKHIGSLLRRYRHYDSAYPITVCLYMVWCGILKYEGGNYWDPVKTSIGLSDSATNDWGVLFEKTVARLNLPSFKDEKTYRFVTPILAHGGVPKSCLDDLFDSLVLPAAEGQFGDLRGAEILREWREDPELLDFRYKAVARFFNKGGRPADDFLERCLRMASHYLDADTILPAGALGLPPHVVEAFDEWVHSEEVEGSAAGDRLRRPYLQLQPGSRVVLHLPVQRRLLAPERLPRLEWKIGALPARRCTSHDRGEILETEPDVLDWDQPRKPVRCALLEDGKELRSWTLEPFVPLGQEWLFLDAASGRPLPPGPLPRAEVWLLGDVNVRGTGLRILEELPPLVVDGRAWPFRCLDLTRLKSVLEVQRLAQRHTFVCEPEVPWLENGVPVPDMDTSAGFPVYHRAAPDLCVPRESGGVDALEGWTLMLRPLPGSYPIHLKAYRLQQLADFVALEPEVVRLPLRHLLPQDSAGRFELTLTGPLGRDRSFNFALIPELRGTWRLGDDDPSVEVHCPDGVFRPDGSSEWVDEGDGHLVVSTTPEQRFLSGTLATSRPDCEVQLPLRLWIPLPRWRVTGVAECDQGWTRSMRPLPLEAVDGAKAACLWIECPPASTGALQVALEATGQPLQLQRVGTGARGEACVPLAGFHDTLRQAQRPSLQFTLQVPSGEEWRKLTVLALRSSWAPSSFAASYPRRGGAQFLRLSWDGPAVVRDRALRFRSLWRPDRPPLELPVPDDENSVEIEVGPGGLDPGRYALEFAIQDEWGIGLVVAGQSRQLNVLPDRWEDHLGRKDPSSTAVLERLLAVLDFPDLFAGVLGTPERLAIALCRDRSPDALREVLSLLAGLETWQSERVWPYLVPHLPLDESGVHLLLGSSARLAGKELLQLTLRAGLPQAQPEAIDEAGRRKLSELWRPYGLLFAPPDDAIPTGSLGELVAYGPDLGLSADDLLDWVAELAPRVRDVLAALQRHPGPRAVRDRLLQARRQDEQTSHWRSYKAEKYLEFQQYAGTWALMAVREGRGVVRDRTRRICESRHLVPLGKIAGQSFFDADFCARFVITAVALGQRARARAFQGLEPVSDSLRQLGTRCFRLDRNFYGDCLVAAESELRLQSSRTSRGA